MVTSRFFRLCSRAPRMRMASEMGELATGFEVAPRSAACHPAAALADAPRSGALAPAERQEQQGQQGGGARSARAERRRDLAAALALEAVRRIHRTHARLIVGFERPRRQS